MRRLQQQAETEQRVELFARRLSQQQAHLQPSVGQQRQQQQPSVLARQQLPVPEQQARRAQSHQASEELSGSEDDWEVEEVDDGMVAYAWKSKDELLQQWDEQQSKELPLPPIPEPSCADEASLLLAQFRPSRRKSQELKRLLEARANPDIVVTTEIWGGICPLAKVIARKQRTYRALYSRDYPWISQGSLCTPLHSLPRAPIRISSVDEMRELLLEYGATNTRELQQDWRRCKAAIENDPVWLEKFHHDPR